MPDLPKYHVESRKRNGKDYYYLVKYVCSGKKCTRVTKYIDCHEFPPTEQEIKEFTLQHFPELEEKAQKKQIQYRLEALKIQYLSTDLVHELENIRYLSKYITSIVSVDDSKAEEDNFEWNYIHGTTAIEGNTLTLNETIDLLEKEIIPDRELREINEVQNYICVAEYLKKYHKRVTIKFIKELHKIIMSNILKEPGEFRMSDRFLISGYDYQLTPALLIEEELTTLIDEYYENLAEMQHPFECAILFHYKFETIHPFADGNGRVGRELLNYLLMQSGYPRILFSGERQARAEYLGALKAGNDQDNAKMISVFAEILITQRKDAMEQNKKNIPVLIRRKLRNDPKTQQKLDSFKISDSHHLLPSLTSSGETYIRSLRHFQHGT